MAERRGRARVQVTVMSQEMVCANTLVVQSLHWRSELMVRVKVRVRHRVHVQGLADVVGLDEIFAQNFALQFYSICCKQHSYILCSWLNNLILVRCPTFFFSISYDLGLGRTRFVARVSVSAGRWYGSSIISSETSLEC